MNILMKWTLLFSMAMLWLQSNPVTAKGECEQIQTHMIDQ